MAMLPTYNEAENIKQAIDEILNCGLDIEVLVVDDMSPDGTYKIVEEISKNNPKVHLLLRKEQRGRGYAGIEGFKKALALGAQNVLEMDADGSHSPKYIPILRNALKNYDAAIGSRYIYGGKDEARTLLRRAISAFSRRYLAFIIGTKIKDPTSGFRMFKKEALEKFVHKLKSSDPFIVAEVVYYLKKYDCSVAECPIEFMPRIAGKSKLRPATLIKYLFKALKLRIVNL
jgi:dolichol-phosphate mannosyltransferase